MKYGLIYYMNDIGDSFIESAQFKEKKRSAGFIKYVAAAACICLVAVAGVYMLSDNEQIIKPSQSDSASDTSVITPEVTTADNIYEQTPPVPDDTVRIALVPFESTIEKDPDSDAYGEDELPHIDIYLNGEYLYVQATDEDLKELSIDSDISASDFGEYLGKVTELLEYDNPLLTPCSQEPTLAGCEVYRYVPAGCEAVVIVKSNEKCSLFVSSDMLGGDNYERLYRLFGVESSDDIVKINYEIYRPDENSSLIELTAQGTVENKADIEYFYDVTKSLRAIVRESALSGDPQWLIDASREYFSLSDRYEVRGEVVTRCGLTLEFSYIPQFGDGYFPQSHFITKEQNAVLKKMFEE